MDSGYEAVPVDGNVATTNGVNGTHEEVPEMKTRSKVAVGGGGDAPDDESAKPKVRPTRTAAQKSGVADDKDGGSDGEKTDKKKNLRGAGDAEEAAAAGAKNASKEAAEAGAASNGNSGSAKTATSSAKIVTSGTAGAVSATGASACKAKPGNADACKAKPGNADSSKAVSSAAAAPTSGAAASASARKVPERDDDSGINSRASSVSNDDVATPARVRTRTRSSYASKIESTSASAFKRAGGARVPLSIYEFDDDPLPPPIGGDTSTSKAAFRSSAQKRKAVVYVEEMEDEDDEAPEQGVEPAAKRRAAFLVSAGVGIATSLGYPVRTLRRGIAAIRPRKAAAAVASAERGEQENGIDDAVADESTEASSLAGSETVAQRSSDQQRPGETTNTCSLM